MSFDKTTRNALSRMVGQARERLKADITAQLQTDFRLQPDGAALDLDGLTEDQRAAALDLRQLLDHFAAGEPTAVGRQRSPLAPAYERLVREIGFTVLNRLAALRLCEERGLVVECVRQGMASEGFLLFDRLTGGALGPRYATYCAFLENLFDELALDLGALFERGSPLSHVFPSERALEDVLALLNNPALAHLWREDETIGWIYQYYNDEAERKKMREESQAPRNSRELAVRNQFFTPRYVVEFLADNTLGRLWYEMRGGDTHLAEQCRYLVKRESVMRDPEDSRITHHVSRPKKDPRDIKMLDPAGGSGHFGLYCFDLFETIYAEAYDDPKLGPALQADYPDRTAFLRDVPRLILAHNLHIIDIDPRACQIAALAIWLRAQRSWQGMGLKPGQRPRIRRANVVCAEPMPGERDLLEEFIAVLDPPELGELVRFVFDRMQLAGEAGSLLKIEEELRKKIEELKTKAGPLFAQGDFWDRAEPAVVQALKDYAEHAANGQSARRQLFADDAAQGFAFIDLCRQRYDVVLMNPPFGEVSPQAKAITEKFYPNSKADIGLAFVERGLNVCHPSGTVGAITSRVLVANDSLERWRNKILINGRRLRAFADLGFGVLDGALVEAAAYAIDVKSSFLDSFFVRVLDERDKELAMYSFFVEKQKSQRTFPLWRNLRVFDRVPGKVLCYWLPDRLLARIVRAQNLVQEGGTAKHGLQTTDDFRFLRLVWEIPPHTIGRHQSWVHFAKGGEYQPYWDDIHLTIKWANDGQELKSYVSAKAELTQGSGGWSRWINSWDDYFKPGLTFPERTTSDFSVRALAANCIFSATGEALLFPTTTFALAYLGGAYTRHYKLLIDAFVGSGDSSVPGSAANHYRSGLINSIPAPCKNVASTLEAKIREAIQFARQESALIETSREFCLNGLCIAKHSLRDAAKFMSDAHIQQALYLLNLNLEMEPVVQKYLGFETADEELVKAIIGPHPCTYPSEKGLVNAEQLAPLWIATESELMAAATREKGARRQLTKKSFYADRRLELISHYFEVSPEAIVQALRTSDLLGQELIHDTAPSLISYIVGLIVGRWDIRIACDPTLAPNLQDPFDPLPVCPPGMLVGPDGLPASPGHIVSEAWLRARPNAITLPPRPLAGEGQAVRATIQDDEYPLRIAWDGILVDDPGLDDRAEHPHAADVVRRVREVLNALWGERAEAIEAEACEILGVASLRDYFRKPSGFFTDHLKRYSKSRRQAPIYWPLSTASGRYTVWLCYHRLNQDTLYTVVVQYVTPKLDEVQKRLDQLAGKLAGAPVRAAAELRDQLNDLKNFQNELADLRAELLRVAALPYKPDLNDGAIINAAPLHKLFRLRKWAADTAAVWKKLEAGEYDWAHMAYTLWPERVKKVCETDRSIAIAHELEELCKVEAKQPSNSRRSSRKEPSDEDS